MIKKGTKEYFETLLNVSIRGGSGFGGWDYNTNGCFQWCNAKVPIVYHCDSQKYAGIVYLTPDAPPNCGTSFYRDKKHKMRNNEIFQRSDWHDSALSYREPHLDKTPWEVVDSVGNVFNRLVIFDAHYVHAVTEYFGEDIQNSRLFQLFFFDVEKSKVETPPKVGMDIGASRGDTLNLFDDCDTVYAFEPHPILFESLKKSPPISSSSRRHRNIIASDYAIHDTNGTSKFNTFSHWGYSSLLDFDTSGEMFAKCKEIDNGFDDVRENGFGERSIDVKTKRLDTFIEENGIGPIHFIKVDTQGNDFRVVKSLGKYIKNVYKIEVEVQLKSLYKDSGDKDEIIEFMERNNFHIEKVAPNSSLTEHYEERITFVNNTVQ